MSDIEKKAGLEAEPETGITHPDGSSTSSEQLKPGGKWDTFQKYNSKLEAALGIEAVSVVVVADGDGDGVKVARRYRSTKNVAPVVNAARGYFYRRRSERASVVQGAPS